MTEFTSIVTNKGENIEALSRKGVVMLVFLRHLGCIFCQEALTDISKHRSNWEKKGINIVLVHPSEAESSEMYFSRFDLQEVNRIADPDCKIYEQFGLVKGSFSQLFGLRTMIRGFQVSRNYQLAKLKTIGDGFQMPGIFIIRDGEVVNKYIHSTVSDKPDYEKLISKY
jgi:peroxiredoxin